MITPNKRYTFENMAKGRFNRDAYEACETMSKQEKNATYNLLYICGYSGAGKTHLLNAIANRITDNDRTLNVIYITGEGFRNEFSYYRRKGMLYDFQKKFRSTDVFIIDDIDFINMSGIALEEILSIICELCASKKRVIISGRGRPDELSDMLEKLIMGLNGLIVEISSPPDREAVIEIIGKKIDLYDMEMDEDSVSAVADYHISNVRECEGMLLNLKAISQVRGVSITAEFVKEVLGEMVKIRQTDEKDEIEENEGSSKYGESKDNIFNVINIIPSDDVREYLIKNNIMLDDMQKAAIIYHSLLTLKDKNDMLYELGSETKDAELRKQLMKYLVYTEKSERIFKDNSEKKFVYRVVFNVENYNEKTGFYDEYEDIHEGCFLRFEDAVGYAVYINKYEEENKYYFKINKSPLFNSVEKYDEIDAEYAVSTAYFDEAGRMRQLYENENPENKQNSEERENFKFIYVDIPNPFELGDIVEYKSPDRKTREIHIVNISREGWNEYKRKINEKNNTTGLDFSDMVITESVLCPDGRFKHCHKNPMYLQKIKLADSDPRKEIIEAAAEIVQGKMSLDLLQYYTKEYISKIQ